VCYITKYINIPITMRDGKTKNIFYFEKMSVYYTLIGILPSHEALLDNRKEKQIPPYFITEEVF